MSHPQIIPQKILMSDRELQTLIITKLTDLATGQAEIATDMAAGKAALGQVEWQYRSARILHSGNEDPDRPAMLANCPGAGT